MVTVANKFFWIFEFFWKFWIFLKFLNIFEIFEHFLNFWKIFKFLKIFLKKFLKFFFNFFFFNFWKFVIRFNYKLFWGHLKYLECQWAWHRTSGCHDDDNAYLFSTCNWNSRHVDRFHVNRFLTDGITRSSERHVLGLRTPELTSRPIECLARHAKFTPN